jgi:hypothetical protein
VPTAADLISLFLYQADVSANIAREINGKENISVNGGNQVSLQLIIIVNSSVGIAA